MDKAICDKYIAESVKLLKDLVSINTCQPYGNEDTIVNYIMGCFPQGTDMVKIQHSPERSSLVVRIKGKRKDGGLAFVGHIDTVACGDLSLWTYPPHSAYEENGVVYGRGAADMKGGVAAMTCAALSLIESGMKLACDMYFCYTADEEKDGIGIKSIVERGMIDGVSQIIIAEPSEDTISTCEKGALWIHINAKGIQAHASRPEVGLNAIHVLIEFYNMFVDKLDTCTEHPLLGTTSAAVTKLSGGIMTNIIPASAEMEMDIRAIPGQTNEEILKIAYDVKNQLCRTYPKVQLEVNVLNDRPSVEVKPDTPIVQNMRKVFEEFGAEAPPKGTYFYTDMSQIAPYIQVPFIILGPGDDKKAHSVNECIDITSLHLITKIYIRYIEKFCMEEL